MEYEGCARQPDSHIVIVSTFKLCEAKAKQGVDSLCSNVANQKPEKHPNWTEQVQLMEETDCAYCHDEGKSFLEEGRFVYEDVRTLALLGEIMDKQKN